MTFDKWLSLEKISDAEAASRLKRDRAHISKLRRGRAKPSYELMLAIYAESDGAVTLDSWAPERKLARAG